MKNTGKFVLAAGLAFATTGSSQATTLTLTQALERARSESLEIQQASSQLAAQKAREASVDGAYDPVIFSKYQLTDDTSAQNSQFAGDERRIRTWDVGVKKLFSTGTQAEVKFSYEKFLTMFPPGFNSPTAIVNPSHTSQIQLSLKQPLWRNFLAREIRLQKSIQTAHSHASDLQVQLRKQLVQAETEQLYLNIAALQAQLDITKKLVKKTNTLAKLMKSRQKLGRADDIDVIAAESRVVQTDSQLLNLEISTEDTKEKLASLLNMPRAQVVIPSVSALETSLTPVSENFEQATTTAKQQRLDLQLTKAQMRPYELQQHLAKEGRKPSINLFASLSSNSVNAERNDSHKDSFDFDNKTTAVGVELEWTPYNRKSSYEEFAAQAQYKATQQQLKMHERDLERDIRLALHKKTSAVKQRNQAQKQIASFDSKIAAEKRRYKQARAERISIISHEIEKLNAQMNLITANLNARQAEAMLRLAMHAYPRK